MIIFYLSSVIVVVMFSTLTYGIEYVDVFFMVHCVCQFIFHVLNDEVTIMVAYGLYGLLTLFYLFRFFDFQNFLDSFLLFFFFIIIIFMVGNITNNTNISFTFEIWQPYFVV